MANKQTNMQAGTKTQINHSHFYIPRKWQILKVIAARYSAGEISSLLQDFSASKPNPENCKCSSVKDFQNGQANYTICDFPWEKTYMFSNKKLHFIIHTEMMKNQLPSKWKASNSRTTSECGPWSIT